MPSKRFLSTAAPLAILALAGMGLATAQSSSPFASKNRAQAWEQPTQNQAPRRAQAWEQTNHAPPYTPPSYAAPAPTYASAPQPAPQPYTAPSYRPSQPAPQQQPFRSQPAPSQAIPPSDAPITTRPVPAPPVYQTASTATPPKNFSGQPQYQAPYNAPSLAGSSTPPPPKSSYNYTSPRPARVAQAPDFGTPAPPTSAPPASSVPPQYRPPAPTSSSGSPYAPQSQSGYGSPRRQAWETYPQNPPPQQQAPQQQAPQYQAPQQPAPQQQAPQYNRGQYTPNTQTQNSPNVPQGVPPQGFPQHGNQTRAPYPGGPFSQQQPQKPKGWKERLGLSNLATKLRGAFTAGAAVSFRDAPDNQAGPDDGTSEDFVGDAELELEVSAITQGGLEYGFTLGGRAQYDPYRRGFGGRTPDCPPTVAGCSGQAFTPNTGMGAGIASGLRGHTSGFYSTGEDIAEDFQGDVQSAHLFLRSAYGDVTLGRDDGAAYLFSLGAPSLLALGASNSPLDFTGYDSVKTVNDASGYSEKITYTSPRLLGDQIGVGVQLGVSYALDADVCGVDYCNGRNIDGVIQPEIEDVFEVGLALDRTFQNGVGVELTGTYATGSESSGLAGLDDLNSFGAGLEFTFRDWTLGGSFLDSNNGLLDGDYTAYDAGIIWKPNALGFTLGYGHAEDDNVGLSSDQATFGITYDFKKFTLGTGVQYVDREVNGLDELGAQTTLDQKAASVFVTGGFKF